MTDEKTLREALFRLVLIVIAASDEASDGVTDAEKRADSLQLSAAIDELVVLRAEVERLREALMYVVVGLNDPHPRNSTLDGLRASLINTEAMVQAALEGK